MEVRRFGARVVFDVYNKNLPYISDLSLNYSSSGEVALHDDLARYFGEYLLSKGFMSESEFNKVSSIVASINTESTGGLTCKKTSEYRSFLDTQYDIKNFPYEKFYNNYFLLYELQALNKFYQTEISSGNLVASKTTRIVGDSKVDDYKFVDAFNFARTIHATSEKASRVVEKELERLGIRLSN